MNLDLNVGCWKDSDTVNLDKGDKNKCEEDLDELSLHIINT